MACMLIICTYQPQTLEPEILNRLQRLLKVKSLEYDHTVAPVQTCVRYHDQSVGVALRKSTEAHLRVSPSVRAFVRRSLDDGRDDVSVRKHDVFLPGRGVSDVAQQ